MSHWTAPSPADIAGVVAVLTLVLGVVTLRLDHRRRKRQATLDAYVQAGGYRKALADEQRKARGDKHSDEMPLDFDEALDLSRQLTKRHDAIRDYLNFWENIAIGAKFGVYDKKVLWTMSEHVVCEVYRRYSPFIYFVRWGENQPKAYRARRHGRELRLGKSTTP